MKFTLSEAVAVVALVFGVPNFACAQDVLTLRGVVANVSWGTSRGTVEVQSFETTGKPIRSFVEGVDLSDLWSNGIQRNAVQRGDNVTVCGSPSKTPRPDGLVSITADLLILSDGRQVVVGNSGAKECLAAVQPPRPDRPRGGRGGIGPITNSPVQPMLSPPVQPMMNSPVQPITAPPVFPLGSPRNGTTRPASAPDQAPQRIPLDALDLSYLQLYDHNRPIQIAGRVTKVDWTQPNTYVYLTVGGVPWVVECSYTQFKQVAASPAIRIGDTITIAGFLPRENPVDQLPAKTLPAVESYFKSNHLARAGSITIFTGQKLALGDPPTDEELAKREKCSYFLGC